MPTTIPNDDENDALAKRLAALRNPPNDPDYKPTPLKDGELGKRLELLDEKPQVVTRESPDMISCLLDASSSLIHERDGIIDLSPVASASRLPSPKTPTSSSLPRTPSDRSILHPKGKSFSKGRTSSSSDGNKKGGDDNTKLDLGLDDFGLLDSSGIEIQFSPSAKVRMALESRTEDEEEELMRKMMDELVVERAVEKRGGEGDYGSEDGEDDDDEEKMWQARLERLKEGSLGTSSPSVTATLGSDAASIKTTSTTTKPTTVNNTTTNHGTPVSNNSKEGDSGGDLGPPPDLGNLEKMVKKRKRGRRKENRNSKRADGLDSDDDDSDTSSISSESDSDLSG